MTPDDQPDEDDAIHHAVYPTEIEREMERAVAILAELPGGNVLGELIRGWVARRQNRRLDGFLRRLRDDLRAVEDRINQDFVGTEDFEDLAEEIFARASDTRQEEKLEAYRNLFVNTVTADDPDFGDAAEIAALVARWQPIHIAFLRDFVEYLRTGGYIRHRFYDEASEGGIRNRALREIARTMDWEYGDVRRVYHELRANGVVWERTQRSRRWNDEEVEMEFRVSEFGEHVIEFLSREPDDRDE